jgi:hypothetical protein
VAAVLICERGRASERWRWSRVLITDQLREASERARGLALPTERTACPRLGCSDAVPFLYLPERVTRPERLALC